MYKIAICDDEVACTLSIKDRIDKYCQQKNIECDFILYNDEIVFRDEIREGASFDMIWLDIEMPKLNGVELARIIREKLPHVVLIFLSAYEEYAIEAFKVKTHRFVPKTAMEIHFEEALESALKELKSKKQYLFVDNKESIQKILLNDIFYMERCGKFVEVFLESESIRIRKTLKEVYETLPEGEFVWGNRGQIVNLRHVKLLQDKLLVLENGVKIPLVRGKIREMRKAWMDYGRGRK